MEGTDQEKIISALKEKFEGDVLQVELLYDFLTITLKKDQIISIIRHLYDHPDTQFQYLTTLCGIHFPDQNQIAVMYQLHSLTKNYRIRLKIYLPVENPVTPTLTTVFPAANWLERETFDFFGVIFERAPESEAHFECGGYDHIPVAEGVSAGGSDPRGQERYHVWTIRTMEAKQEFTDQLPPGREAIQLS